MKHLKYVSLLLAILLLISGCSNNKIEERITTEDTSLEKTFLATTEISTTTQEVIEKQTNDYNVVTEPTINKLFDDNMTANFENYKTYEYEIDDYIISTKIPENWIEEECDYNNAPFYGIKFYNYKPKNKIEFAECATVFIGVFARGKNDLPGCELNDYTYTDNITTLTSLNCDVFYNMLDNYYSIYVRILNENLCDVGIYISINRFFGETKQEIFNVLNSIEIIEKDTGN